MSTVRDIYNAIEKIAPFGTAMSFDNAGMMVGDMDEEVTKAVLALDVTGDVIAQAEKAGAQLVVSHHPVIFHPLKRLDKNSIPYKLAAAGLNAISAHTNYDLAEKGVNKALAEALGLQNIRAFVVDENGLAEGLAGELPTPMEPEEFAAYVKEKLNCGGLSYTEGNKKINTVAVGCGAASYLLHDAMQAADAFVTGESKHDQRVLAGELGFTMVTAGHFNTENPAMYQLAKILRNAVLDVDFILAEQTEPEFYL